MENVTVYFRDPVYRSAAAFVKGSAFIDNRLFSRSDLAEYFNNASDVEKAVSKANGFFGVVVDREDAVFIGADKIRSVPLFYGVHEGKVYVSDDPYWLREIIGGETVDPDAEKEFLVLGYVSGPDTLYRKVKQIQAGELVRIRNDESGNPEIATKRYYQFVHRDVLDISEADLLKLHDHNLKTSFERFIRYAAGRPVFIPLSGGYDSRLTATMLKYMGYLNITTFTFGKMNNNDYTISKRVAGKLGLKWLYVPYDNPKTYRWYNSPERNAFGKMADNLCSVLLDREWPAVWELHKSGVLPSDAVFAPGHSGDFVSGGGIPPCLWKKDAGEKELMDAILRKHYSMWDWRGMQSEWEPFFTRRIRRCIESESFRLGQFHGEPDARRRHMADAFEKWEWQEKQAKHLVNPVRIYDFFGYDWWLPLWDAEYLDFWTKVPLLWRTNRRLYKKSVFALYAKTTGVGSREAKRRDSSLDKFRFDSLLYHLGSRISGDPSLLMKVHELRESDWEQSYGRMNPALYSKLLPFIKGRSSIATLEKLGYIHYTREELPIRTLDLLRKMKGR